VSTAVGASELAALLETFVGRSEPDKTLFDGPG